MGVDKTTQREYGAVSLPANANVEREPVFPFAQEAPHIEQATQFEVVLRQGFGEESDSDGCFSSSRSEEETYDAHEDMFFADLH